MKEDLPEHYRPERRLRILLKGLGLLFIGYIVVGFVAGSIALRQTPGMAGGYDNFLDRIYSGALGVLSTQTDPRSPFTYAVLEKTFSAKIYPLIRPSIEPGNVFLTNHPVPLGSDELIVVLQTEGNYFLGLTASKKIRPVPLSEFPSLHLARLSQTWSPFPGSKW